MNVTDVAFAAVPDTTTLVGFVTVEPLAGVVMATVGVAAAVMVKVLVLLGALSTPAVTVTA
ncbi:hypothetical protein COEX109129_12100 [Corallococcus exiguus]